uniref:Uncharacterized protein n=1 Tax=Oryza punctata TaxID=4537 RepID=A0A0E0LWK9_ORYPU
MSRLLPQISNHSASPCCHRRPRRQGFSSSPTQQLLMLTPHVPIPTESGGGALRWQQGLCISRSSEVSSNGVSTIWFICFV